MGNGLKFALIEILVPTKIVNSFYLLQGFESFLTLSFISLFLACEIQLFIVLILNIFKLNNTTMTVLEISFIHALRRYHRYRYGTIIPAVILYFKIFQKNENRKRT